MSFAFMYGIFVSILFLLTTPPQQGGRLEDYRRAEKLLPMNTQKLVAHMDARPSWIEDSSKFWYVDGLFDDKKRFVLVDPTSGSIGPAFDHQRLAEALTNKTGYRHSANDLLFESFEFGAAQRSMTFRIGDDEWWCDLVTYELSEVRKGKRGISPDGKWIAFCREHNLWLRSTRTGREHRLSTNGIEKRDYAFQPSWHATLNISSPSQETEEPEVSVNWSHDSKRLVTLRMDRRRAQNLYLLQSVPEQGFRAQVWAYERSLPGDTEYATVEWVIFDIATGRRTPVQLDPQPSFLVWSLPQWSKDSQRLWITIYKRGYQQLDLFEIDAATGTAKVLITETSKTNVDADSSSYHPVNDGEKILWTSERDGWNHIYLYDGKTGALEKQLTSGEWVVREILHVDEEDSWVYFSAGGKERGRDPYLQHVYRISLDGGQPTLLTPENAEHETAFSPDGTVFTDTYSRVDLPPRSVLRSSEDGSVLLDLGQGDVSRLLSAGWIPPEAYTVKARDGTTDLYGVVYLPPDLDPDKKYPVIDATYSGPHAVRTPKSYARAVRGGEQALAQLGFIVFTIDGMGTAKRSKAFHDVSWANLGDIGAPDHIGALEQLNQRYGYFDLDRVGIFGHSAGGYDAAHAVLTHPDFYKVAVASAGNHDHRMAKVWWPEVYMGPFGDHYKEQSNLTLAENLEGKLLLVHGDMDNNVNPASTIRLVDELIKANKDFDLLILPNVDHDIREHTYFIRKRWDYFVKHLLGVEPPSEYRIIVKDDSIY
jgi:dipeptidyl aminopeptidase/acylaminoacyl peptidase